MLALCILLAAVATGGRALGEARVHPEATDRETVAAVQASIAADPTLAMAARDVAVTSSQGRVALTGTAPDAETKRRVATVAKWSRGVASVCDEVVVAPHGSS